MHPPLARHSIMHLHHLNPTFPYPRTSTLTHSSHPLHFVSQNQALAARFSWVAQIRSFPTSQPLDHSLPHSISVPSIEIEHPPRFVSSGPNTPPWRSPFQSYKPGWVEPGRVDVPLILNQLHCNGHSNHSSWLPQSTALRRVPSTI